MPVRSPLSSVTPGALDRDVGARAHGDADVRGGQRRRVVDAVAGHRDDAALPPCSAARRRSSPRAGPRPRPRRCRAGAPTASAVVRLSPVSITTRMPSALSAASASGVDGLDRIGDGEHAGQPARRRRRRSPWRRPGADPRPLCEQRRDVDAVLGQELGVAERRSAGPRPCRARPCPTGESKSLTGAVAMPRGSAAATMASASGCSLARSTLAARRSSSRSSKPGAGTIAVTAGLPSVSVPVLSTTSVSTFSMRSSASAFLISTPACAPRPTPTMIDIGVARPSAQGQAMMRTRHGRDQRVGEARLRPNSAQATKASTATAITGRDEPARRPGRRGAGWARGCAAPRRPSGRCAPAWCRARPCSARMTSAPVWLSVPPIDRRAGLLRRPASTRRSPSTRRRSSRPSTTSPSTGTFSPGRTRRRSPTCDASRGTSSSVPSGADAPRGLGRQVEQRADRAAVSLAGAQLQHLARAAPAR